MCGVVAVAAFAGDAVVSEERRVVSIFGASDGRARGAGVAIEAAGIGGEIHRHELRVLKGGRGVPDFLLGVPVDGGFEEKAVEREEIGAAAVAGADEVLQAAGAVHRGIVGAIEREHGGVVFSVDAIVDAGSGVGEVGGSELVDGLAAGSGHGGLGVGGGDGGVAFGAGFVAGGSRRLLPRAKPQSLFESRSWEFEWARVYVAAGRRRGEGELPGPTSVQRANSCVWAYASKAARQRRTPKTWSVVGRFLACGGTWAQEEFMRFRVCVASLRARRLLFRGRRRRRR